MIPNGCRVVTLRVSRSGFCFCHRSRSRVRWPARIAVTRCVAGGLAEETASAYGRLDYQFNNAGIAIGGDARDLTLDQWRRVLDVDLYGVLYGTLAAYPIMVNQGFGHIVNTSSAAGLLPTPLNAPYCTAKHAVVGLSLSLRAEGADLGVKVSAVCPGYVRTPIFGNAVVVNLPRKLVDPQSGSRLSMLHMPRRRSWTVWRGTRP